MKRDLIDFHLVADEHIQVHARLEAWARWVQPRPFGWHVAPMFRYYRPPRKEDEPVSASSPRPQVSTPECIAMENAVAQLPHGQREAIRWCYFWSQLDPRVAKANGWAHGPIPMAHRLGVAKEELMDLIWQGRSMLINRNK